MFDHVDTQRLIGTIEWINEDGDEVCTKFPLKFEVCDRCGGRGTHCNPNIDGNGLTREDFDEDPDFAEGYFSGRYDVTCEECHGARVMPVCAIDEEKFSEEQKEAFDHMCENERSRRDDERTMRMESGGWG